MTRAAVVGLTAFLLVAASIAIAAGSATLPEDWRTELDEALARGDCDRARELVHAVELADASGALAFLGAVFEEGAPCLAQDEARAAAFYRRAAERGDALAMVRLGRLHAEGRGVAKDRTLARHWFRAAVLAFAALDAEARARLLRMALADRPVPELLDQQLVWLRVIEAGGPDSVFALVERMRTGDGVPKNEAVAATLMEDLALGGLVAAQYELGLWQASRAAARGEPCTPVATRYLMIAADNGHPLAQAKIGRCYAREVGYGSLAYGYLLAAQAGGVDVSQDLAQLKARLSPAELGAGRDTAVYRGLLPGE